MTSKPSDAETQVPKDFEKTIIYDTTSYTVGPGVDASDLKLSEDWQGRPASQWSVKRIGMLQARIEQYMYSIYHRRYIRLYSSTNSNNSIHDKVSGVERRRGVSAENIPTYKLINFANEVFGYDGWFTEIVNIETHECYTVPNRSASKGGTETTGTDFKSINYDVTVEADVKLVLRDGTYTESSGTGRGVLPSKGASYSKAKKQAVNNAIKSCMLSFEVIITEYNEKVKSNYYVDNLFVNEIKREKGGFSPYK